MPPIEGASELTIFRIAMKASIRIMPYKPHGYISVITIMMDVSVLTCSCRPTTFGKIRFASR
jgi:hypothetical protein